MTTTETTATFTRSFLSELPAPWSVACELIAEHTLDDNMTDVDVHVVAQILHAALMLASELASSTELAEHLRANCNLEPAAASRIADIYDIVEHLSVEGANPEWTDAIEHRLLTPALPGGRASRKRRGFIQGRTGATRGSP